jgi:hypothetical protein
MFKIIVSCILNYTWTQHIYRLKWKYENDLNPIFNVVFGFNDQKVNSTNFYLAELTWAVHFSQCQTAKRARQQPTALLVRVSSTKQSPRGNTYLELWVRYGDSSESREGRLGRARHFPRRGREGTAAIGRWRRGKTGGNKKRFSETVGFLWRGEPWEVGTHWVSVASNLRE